MQQETNPWPPIRNMAVSPIQNDKSKIMNKLYLSLIISVLSFAACNPNRINFDAAGNFEADEVIVAARQNGEILNLNLEEGQRLALNEVVGQIDVEAQKLQKAQTLASMNALSQKTGTSAYQVEVVKKQLATQQAQMQQLNTEKRRIQNLVKADAAPGKQLDDINAQITQLNAQMAATRAQIDLYNSNVATQNRSILSERNPLEKATDAIQYQISRGEIVNPIAGIVLSKYALKGEMATIGRALYKIANIDTLNLKAYVTGDQLPQIKLNQTVQVRIDDGKGGYKSYPGTIFWISDKSEFTPKTIQTKKERENLVYAIKVRVKNDGFLKIGMYGEVLFNSPKKNS